MSRPKSPNEDNLRVIKVMTIPNFIILIFGIILCIWPPGVTIYMVTPPPSTSNVFCGYFVLLKYQNLEVICLIPIFGVIFGQNLDIWPPGVTIYMVIPHCLVIHFEEILPCFVLNVSLCLFCIIKKSNFGINLPNTDIWGHFWSKFG